MRSSTRILALLAISATSFAAQGGPIASKYCSAGGTHASALSTSDMSYGVNGPLGPTAHATDCYGVLEKHGADFGANGGNSSAAIINQIWGSASGAKTTWGDGEFFELVKKDIGQSGTGSTALGYLWSLDGSSAALTGLWTLTATPLAGLPAFFDFVGVLKGSNRSAAYLFDEVLFDGSAGGSWTISYDNPGEELPNLSNLTIYGRLGSTPPPCVGPDCGNNQDPGNGVPAPGSLALVGLALMAAGIVRRRRR